MEKRRIRPIKFIYDFIDTYITHDPAERAFICVLIALALISVIGTIGHHVIMGVK